MEYRSIKVPEITYEAAKRARIELIKKGTSLPEQILKPEECPICGESMHEFHTKYTYYSCGGCGYKQQSFDVKGTAVPTLGDVIGMGIAFLTFLAITGIAAEVVSAIFQDNRGQEI